MRLTVFTTCQYSDLRLERSSMEGSTNRKGESSVLRTVEMHTGGDPVRIIISGYPTVSGETLLEKRRYVRDHLDSLRTALIHEPRGHNDMYGALLVEPDREDADLAVLFLHKQGYSTVCGHATIALGRYAVDYDLVKPVSPETKIKIQCPCGVISAFVDYNSETRQTSHVRLHSVPAYAFATDQTILLDDYGYVKYSIGYGGAFFVIVNAQQLNMDLVSADIQSVISLGHMITTAVGESVSITHPESDDLAYIFGTILTDGPDTKDRTENICIYGDKQVARAPCGSGVIARIAVQFHKNQMSLGEERTYINAKVGSEMRGKAISTVQYGPYKAVIVELSGHAHYTGRCEFWMEDGDQLASGFLVE